MTVAPNSLQARDIAYTVHPYTNLRQHERQGPLVITGGDGVYVIDDDGKRYIEGLAGLWCAALGFSEKRLAEAAKRQMEKLPYTHSFAHRSSRADDRAGGEAGRDRAGADHHGLLRQFRLRGDRHRDQADLVLQQRPRPAREEEDHRAQARPITASPSPPGT